MTQRSSRVRRTTGTSPTRVARLAVPALALALAGVLTAACSSSGSGNPSAGSTGSSSTATNGGGAAPAHGANVTITAANGCVSDARTFAAGGITFKIQNKDATAVSEVELLAGERIVGEKENIPPGLGGEFAVTVPAGRYTMYCPGAKVENTTLTVTGKAAHTDSDTAALLEQATQDYKHYVDTQVGYLVTFAQKLDDALHGTSLAAAQKAYMLARPYYEKIEPVAESFTNGKDNLDADIDARINDVPKGHWTGFHPIEQGLFARRSLHGLTTLGDGLVGKVNQLRQKTATLTYQAPDLANGAQELLDEVASSKVTGEEERYSHIDILDMASNIEGSQQAFADLQPVMTKLDASLTSQISGAFQALDKLVQTYRTTSNPSGYVYYSALNDSDRHTLSAAVKAVQEPLSQVASKVANA